MFSHSSGSAEKRFSHSLSPPNHNHYQAYGRSSVHSTSSKKKPHITFTYQGRFRHEFQDREGSQAQLIQ